MEAENLLTTKGNRVKKQIKRTRNANNGTGIDTESTKTESEVKTTKTRSRKKKVAEDDGMTNGIIEESGRTKSSAKKRKMSAPSLKTTPNRIKIKKSRIETTKKGEENHMTRAKLNEAKKIRDKKTTKAHSEKVEESLKVEQEVKIELPITEEGNLVGFDGVVVKQEAETKGSGFDGVVVKQEEETKGDDAKEEMKEEESDDPLESGRKFVGGHVSIIGGLYKAVHRAVEIGAKSFAIFLKNQKRWNSAPLDEAVADKFIKACEEHEFSPDMIVPHGSYLMNCGSPNPETLRKSRDGLLDELQRCERLGLTIFNFHPGSSCGEIPVEKCLDNIGESINLALAKTKSVIAVIENMSCQGHTVGGLFSELRGIIDRVEDKTRIGVCLDTCHAFAAGYDLSSESGYNKMIADFDSIVGFKYLKAVHVNDSMGDVGCHRDRHEQIGKGKIGLAGFRRLMNDPHFNNVPLVLETPDDGQYAKEIKLLNSLNKKK